MSVHLPSKNACRGEQRGQKKKNGRSGPVRSGTGASIVRVLKMEKMYGENWALSRRPTELGPTVTTEHALEMPPWPLVQ